MKTIALATLVLTFVAGHAVASTFPEKAESRVPLMSKVYVDDVSTNLPQKWADRIHRTTGAVAFGGTATLMIDSATSSKPIFSPNR